MTTNTPKKLICPECGYDGQNWYLQQVGQDFMGNDEYEHQLCCDNCMHVFRAIEAGRDREVDYSDWPKDGR